MSLNFAIAGMNASVVAVVSSSVPDQLVTDEEDPINSKVQALSSLYGYKNKNKDLFSAKTLSLAFDLVGSYRKEHPESPTWLINGNELDPSPEFNPYVSGIKSKFISGLVSQNLDPNKNDDAKK